jgi:thymidylate kinase
MIVCIDGNDGTGKTTLIALLQGRFPDVVFQDRGLPTRMTDGLPGEPADLYLVLFATPETCQRRLAQAGKSLSERYHTLEDLDHYHRRFQEVADDLSCVKLDAEPPLQEVAEAASAAIIAARSS